MRKILASLTLAASLAIPTTIVAAPAAQAGTPFSLTATTNRGTDFTITTNAKHHGGNPLHGKARLYVRGDHLQTRQVDGRHTFRIDRGRVPDGRPIRIKVVIDPWDSNIANRSVSRLVYDPRPASTGQKIVNAARTQVGDRYQLGANGPNAWDCSSLTRHAVKKGTGKTIPRTSSQQRHTGKRVSTPQPGDLVSTPGHIAIYAGNGRIIEAATPRTGVTERRMWQKGAWYIRTW